MGLQRSSTSRLARFVTPDRHRSSVDTAEQAEEHHRGFDRTDGVAQTRFEAHPRLKAWDSQSGCLRRFGCPLPGFRFTVPRPAWWLEVSPCWYRPSGGTSE